MRSLHLQKDQASSSMEVVETPYTERTDTWKKKKKFNNNALAHLSFKDQLLFEHFGQGSTEIVPYACIHQAIEFCALHFPDHVAVEHQGASISYAQLNTKANALADYMLQKGIREGDHIGVFLQRSIEMVIGILATLKVGAAYVPQRVGNVPEEHLKQVINAANIPMVLTVSSQRADIPLPDEAVLTMDTLLKDDTASNVVFILPKPITEDHTAFVIFTSGTTGTPNGVQVSHKNVCNILLTAPGNLGIHPGVKVSQILNIAFDMAAWEILGCLANGGTLVLKDKSIQQTVEQVNVVIATPTILSTVDIDKCTDIHTAAVAGEPCPKTLADTWSEKSVFYNSCGPTETTIINTALPYNRETGRLTIGKPTPNNTVYILDEHLNPLPIGEVGEMWAGGVCVTKGYLSNDVLTKERYKPDPFLGGDHKMFRTRDLGRWTDDGQIEHYGRTDDQVKVKGFRVELDSVSTVLETIPHCKRAATLKYDDKSLIAFVSPKSVTASDARNLVSEKLPYYCVPEIVVAMNELPRTPRGKIDKSSLQEICKQFKIEKGPENQTSNADGHPNYEHVVLPKKKPWILRIWDGPKLMHFNRLFALMLLLNVIGFFWGVSTNYWWDQSGVNLGHLANASLYNFFAAILIRQQLVINLLFALATNIPIHWPLSIRRRAAKIYHFGGIHVGGTISGSLWFVALVIGTTHMVLNKVELPTSYLTTTYTIVALLLVMVFFALPKNRMKKHNIFERTHRFGGWSVLVLFWINALSLLLYTTSETNILLVLLTSHTFWLLTIITVSIVLPWLHLKKVPVSIDNPSSHVAIAKFDYGVTPFAGSSTALSRNPLLEWHSFANIPAPSENGFRLTISRAGDWTGAFIDDLPSHIWVKGIPTAGVGNIDKLFKRVVWVATGSGIGPCLPHMLSMQVPSQLVWATRSPRKTYGDKLVNEILSVQPNAIIWNTDTNGKPDMVKLAYQAYVEYEAEAVICISNKRLTWLVVSELESRNIPAYGAIWDS